MTKTKNGVVVLATLDADLGLVPSEKAKAEAQVAANEVGQTVTLRDPTTDKVLATVKPANGPISSFYRTPVSA